MDIEYEPFALRVETDSPEMALRFFGYTEDTADVKKVASGVFGVEPKKN